MTQSPATYPNYKPSDVSWIGHVPTHWEVRRLKADVSDVVDLTNHRKRNESYVALEHVESWTGRIMESESDATFENQVKRFRPGDVLFGKLRPLHTPTESALASFWCCDRTMPPLTRVT